MPDEWAHFMTERDSERRRQISRVVRVSSGNFLEMYDFMVFGYYAERPIFYEPMVSRAMLQERRSFTLAVPPAADLPKGVQYPTKFEAVYDSTTPAYRFIFSGFSQ